MKEKTYGRVFLVFVPRSEIPSYYDFSKLMLFTPTTNLFCVVVAIKFSKFCVLRLRGRLKRLRGFKKRYII